MSDDLRFMREALQQAERAAQTGEVPVGAVVVHQGQVIGRGHNRGIVRHDVTAHAEIEALREASRALGNYRLEDCELYVTLEPCLMCSGAIFGARIRRVIYGAAEPRSGVAGSVIDVFADARLNPHTEVQGGLLAAECGAALQAFFAQRRQAQQAANAMSFLREDALRTEPALPPWPVGIRSAFFQDLPGLDGLRLHALRAGEGRQTVLALHGPAQWSAAYAAGAAACVEAGWDLLAPDLLGFGLSDKPKKEAWHGLQRHAQVLHALLQRLQPERVWVLAPPDMAPLVQAMLDRLEQAPQVRMLGWLAVDAPDLPAALVDAPYPDAGHRSGPRALPRLLQASSARANPLAVLPRGVWAEQMQAMGYFRP